MQAVQQANKIGYLTSLSQSLLSSHVHCDMPCAMLPILVIIRECLAGHVEAAGEFGLEREAEACCWALAERQAAAAAVLQAAADQAEAIGFSEALAVATDVRLSCLCILCWHPVLGRHFFNQLMKVQRFVSWHHASGNAYASLVRACQAGTVL